MVVSSLDRDEGRRNRVRRRGNLAQCRRLQAAGEQDFGHRQGAGTRRRQHSGVGIAGDPRISRREVSRCPPVADRPGSARARSRARGRDACGLRSAAPPSAHEHVATGRPPGADAGGAVECPTHRCHLDRLPHSARPRRGLPVRRLRRRRRDVCTRRLPLPHLCGRSRHRCPHLHGGGHGAAGLARVARGGTGGTLGAAGGRGGLADRYARMTDAATAAAFAPAASTTKKCRGRVLLPALGRRKYTPIL